jgi:hypothetical protein
MSTVAAKGSTADSFGISALLMSGSLEMMIAMSPFTPACEPQKTSCAPSRCCGERGRKEVSKRRLKDADVLLDGAATHADACDQLALAGERRSAAH